MSAASAGHTEIVKILIDAGADVNAKTNPCIIVNSTFGEDTALMQAAIEGHCEVIKMLIKAGADVNAKDALNQTALTKAGNFGQMEVAEILKAAGAKE